MSNDFQSSEFGLHKLINGAAMRYLSPHFVRAYIEENNCDVNVADEGGWTPLHHAAEFALHEIAKILIVDFGAKVNVQEQYGNTPLISVCCSNGIYGWARGTLETAKLLIENGADKTIKNHKGETAESNSKGTYFDRNVLYYLSGRSDDVKDCKVLTSDLTGRRVSVRLKENIKFAIINYELSEPVGGYQFNGRVSQICDSVNFDRNYPPSLSGVLPSNAILRIYVLNEDGVRSGDFYQLHCDDVDIQIIPEEPVDVQHDEWMGLNVIVRPIKSCAISYQLDGLPKMLAPGEAFKGHFWQMTVRQGYDNYEMVHVEGADGKQAVFFGDEICIEES